MMEQELQEMLSSQEKIFRRLKQLKAFFKYSKKFCDRKFKLVENILEEPDKLDLLRNAVYENERSILRRIFKRKQVLEKRKFFDDTTQEIYDRIVALFNQISDILERQLSVVNTDVESEIVKNLAKEPMTRPKLCELIIARRNNIIHHLNRLKQKNIIKLSKQRAKGQGGGFIWELCH